MWLTSTVKETTQHQKEASEYTIHTLYDTKPMLR